MYIYLILQLLAVLLALFTIVIGFWRLGIWQRVWKAITGFSKMTWLGVGALAVAGIVWFFASNPYPLNFAMPPMMQSKAPGGMPASIPVPKIVEFFRTANQFEQVADVGADPTAVPELAQPDADGIVRFELTAREVIAEVADGITFNYWTYDNQVPGPMFRVQEGQTIEVTLHNDPSSLHPHNIDFHAVTGPGGGGAVTTVEPGESATFQWKALNPGLYVYHCATANISTHNAHGQYGMILVEPKEGLPEVDHEFYVMQGELYTEGGIGKKGLVAFDSQALLDGIPSYVTFNGVLEEDGPRMNVEVGQTVRMYVGNGGLNQISSFHVIGEIFDNVYPEAAIGSDPIKNVQTTAVLPGGASIVEFTVDVPGDYILVDHALARMNKGAWAVMKATGAENPEVFKVVE